MMISTNSNLVNLENREFNNQMINEIYEKRIKENLNQISEISHNNQITSIEKQRAIDLSNYNQNNTFDRSSNENFFDVLSQIGQKFFPNKYDNENENEYSNENENENENEYSDENNYQNSEQENIELENLPIEYQIGNKLFDTNQNIFNNNLSENLFENYKTRLIDTFVNIDSRNRDKIKYPNANNYKILLDRVYTNVKEIKIVSSQIPNLNKNIFHDPLILKNDHMYWQVYSESCTNIYDYVILDNQKILIYINAINKDILDYIFNSDNDDDNIIVEQIIKEKMNKNKNGTFQISFQELIYYDKNFFTKVYNIYSNEYSSNNILKILKNESINGIYFGLQFFCKFYYFGPNWKDCLVLLGILCISDTRYIDVNDENSVPKNSESILVEPAGVLQIINQKDNEYMNNTFKTKVIEVDSGLYDDTRLSNEISTKMSNSNYVYRVIIDENKNETSFKCYKKRFLGNNSLHIRPFFSELNKTQKDKKKFIILIKYNDHNLTENENIRIDKYFSTPDITLNQNISNNIKNFLYGKEFRVHLLKCSSKVDPLTKEVIFSSNELIDFIFTDTQEIIYPIIHNYFYIDLEEQYDYNICQTILEGTPYYGLKYNIPGISRKNLEERKSISSLGDLITKYENIKIIFTEKYTMEKILGFEKVDSMDYLVKKCIRVNNKLFYSPNHNLITGDYINFDNNNEDDYHIKIRYINENYFEIIVEPNNNNNYSTNNFNTIVNTKRKLIRETVSNNDIYFFNMNPIKFLKDKIILILNQDILYVEDFIYFKLLNNKFLDFTKENNIFYCKEYENICFGLGYSINKDAYYVYTLIDQKKVELFFSTEHLVLYQSKLIQVKYYNHMMESGQNDILIKGFTPLDGGYIIYKKNKDNFYFLSNYEIDDNIYRKYKMNIFDICVTSDYFGFKNIQNNLDLFNNSRFSINFESFPYIFCTSKAIGGNVQNIIDKSKYTEISNIFCKFNMPEKLSKDAKMVYDRHIMTSKTYFLSPIPTLSEIDFEFFYPLGIPYDFQNTDHSMVLLIREYYDSNMDTNISSKRGNADDINVFQVKRLISNN
jgi:hypothetical protein